MNEEKHRQQVNKARPRISSDKRPASAPNEAAQNASRHAAVIPVTTPSSPRHQHLPQSTLPSTTRVVYALTIFAATSAMSALRKAVNGRGSSLSSRTAAP